MARTASKFIIGMYIVGMLVTGTMNTLCRKIQLTLESTGMDGRRAPFHKPWFATLNMLLAMACVGVVYWVVLAVRHRLSRSAAVGQSAVATHDPAYARKVRLVAIPAMFDLVATVLSAVGILYIPASVWQLLRGSSIVFGCMFSVVFLKKKMYGFHALGVALCVAGVSLVGVANAETSNLTGSDPRTLMMGMGLVIAGQVVQAAQIIAEEFLMKSVDLPAMDVVGYEGMWGTLMLLFVIIPALWLIPGEDNGHQEDFIDTFVLLKNSKDVLLCSILYLISCGTFNATGIAVTQHLSGVHRMMMDASRTALIWVFGLVVHYGFDPTAPFGEVWTDYSYLQLVGFLILVCGQATYGGILRVPGLAYPQPQTSNPAEKTVDLEASEEDDSQASSPKALPSTEDGGTSAQSSSGSSQSPRSMEAV